MNNGELSQQGWERGTAGNSLVMAIGFWEEIYPKGKGNNGKVSCGKDLDIIKHGKKSPYFCFQGVWPSGINQLLVKLTCLLLAVKMFMRKHCMFTIIPSQLLQN